MELNNIFETIDSIFLGEILYSGSNSYIAELLVPELQTSKVTLTIKGVYIFSKENLFQNLKSIGYIIKNRIKIGDNKYDFYNLIPESLGMALSKITLRTDSEPDGINYPALTRFIKKIHLQFEKRISKFLKSYVEIIPLGADYVEYKNFINNELLNSAVIEIELKIGEIVENRILAFIPEELLKPLCSIVDDNFSNNKNYLRNILSDFENRLSKKYDIMAVTFNELLEKTDNVKLQMFINKVISAGMQPYVLGELYTILNLSMREKLLRNISKQHKNTVLQKSADIIKKFSPDFNRKKQQIKLIEENMNLKLKPVLLNIIEKEKGGDGFHLMQEIILNREIENILSNNAYEDILTEIKNKNLNKEFYQTVSRESLIKSLLDVKANYYMPFISHLSENGKKMFYDDMNYIRTSAKSIDIIKAKINLLKLYKELSGSKKFYKESTVKFKKYLNSIESAKSIQYIYSELTKKYLIMSLLDEEEDFVLNLISKLSSRSKKRVSDDIKALRKKVDEITIFKAKEKIVNEIEGLIESGKVVINKQIT